MIKLLAFPFYAKANALKYQPKHDPFITMILPEIIPPRLRQHFHNGGKLKKVLTVCLLCVCPILAKAQMFSVDDNRGPNRFPTVAVFGGLEPINFEYQGDEHTPGAGTYDFSGNLVRFRLETPGINIYLGFGGGATGLDDISYFDAGIKLGYAIRLLGNRNISLQLPLILRSGYTSASNNDVVLSAAPAFEEGTLEGGAGLNFNARLAPELRFSAGVIPGYGFAFSTREQDGGGSVASAEGQVRFYVDNFFGNAGLSLGYDYNLRDFDIKDDALDYQSRAHSILIGITF